MFAEHCLLGKMNYLFFLLLVEDKYLILVFNKAIMMDSLNLPEADRAHSFSPFLSSNLVFLTPLFHLAALVVA